MAKIKQISGYNQSLFLLDDGTVMGCGINTSGELGLGDRINRDAYPEVILTGVEQILAGSSTSHFLMKDGTVKVCGYGNRGQLGCNTSLKQVLVPTVIPILENVSSMMGATTRVYYLMKNGAIMGCGMNGDYELGISKDNTDKYVPTIIPNMENVKQITVGYGTFFLTKDGTVKACGRNGFYSLGFNTTSTVDTPTFVPELTDVKKIACCTYMTLFLLNNGKVKYCGILSDNSLTVKTPTLIPGLENVIDVACGSGSAFFLMEDYTVKSMWSNPNGQLGLGDTIKRSEPTTIPALKNVAQVIACGSHTFFILKNGTVKGCGYGIGLGLGIKEKILVPTDIAFFGTSKEVHYLYLHNQEAYAEQNNALVQVASDFSVLSEQEKKGLFLSANTELAPIEKIIALKQVRLLIYDMNKSMENPQCTLKAVVDSQIYKSDLMDISDYESLERVQIETNLSGGGVVKVLVTTDSNEYKSLIEGQWKRIDEANVSEIKSKGIDSANLGGITADQWNDFLGNKTQIGFLYILSLQDIDDVCEVKQITLHLNSVGEWEMAMPGVSYTYKYTAKDKMVVTFLQAGQYIVNYVE